MVLWCNYYSLTTDFSQLLTGYIATCNKSVCGLRNAVVCVVGSKAKGRGFKSTHDCSHTVQKPTISPWLFGQCAFNIYLPFIIYKKKLSSGSSVISSLSLVVAAPEVSALILFHPRSAIWIKSARCICITGSKLLLELTFSRPLLALCAWIMQSCCTTATNLYSAFAAAADSFPTEPKKNRDSRLGNHS